MALFLIIPLVIAVPIGIYLYHFLKRVFAFWGMDEKKKSGKVFAVIAAVVITLFAINIWGIAAVIILHVIIISLLLDLIYLVIKKGKLKEKIKFLSDKRLANLYRCGLVPLTISLIILGYGYYNMTHVREKDYTIHTEKNISRDYKVAMLSDLHFETTMDTKKLAEYCEKMEAEKPDMLLLCGDIIDESTSETGIREALRILGSVKTTYGVYYVYGNHERGAYRSGGSYMFPSDAEPGEGKLRKQAKKAGIHVLTDEVTALNDEFILAGRVDESFARSGDAAPRSSTEDLLKETDNNDFILLMDHQPVGLQENEEAGVDLQLSGHTHGGQIWPIGLISDILGFGELNYGYQKSGDFQIAVSSGIGGWGYPIRTGCHSEYLMLTITK